MAANTNTRNIVEHAAKVVWLSLSSVCSCDRLCLRRQRWLNRASLQSETSGAGAQSPGQDWRSALAFWLARTINPPVRPQQDLDLALTELRQLPEATLGRELARFLDLHSFELPQTGDWIQKTHDIWHVVTGLSSSVEDEFILQAFVRAQLFRPSSAIVVLVGLLTGKLSWMSLHRSLYLGRVANNIAQWDITSDWGTPLEEVRTKLGIHRQGISRQTRGLSTP